MEKQNFFDRNKTFIKALLVGFLVLAFTIPTYLVTGLISERNFRKNEVISEISQKWSNQQVMKGPFLKIPYYENQIIESEGRDGKKYKQVTKVLEFKYICPENINLETTLIPEKRKRGVFEVILYNSKNWLISNFVNLESYFQGIAQENILWEKGEILIGISDLKGLNSNFKINGKSQANIIETKKINEDFGNGIEYKINLLNSDRKRINLDYEFGLKGAQNFNFVPIAKNNQVIINSTWENPSFIGNFLPENHKIDKTGFKAKWNISHLNRNLPTFWQSNNFPDFSSNEFGVSLIIKNDYYQKSERSVKYSILIISLTFLAFFFVEIISKQKIHPIQYILIGVALIIFYTLLISISEVSNFNISYLISSVMTIGLIFFYAKSIFSNIKTTIGLAVILFILYAFIFIILQLEDTALLIGSIGVFVILAITMFFSKKITWYQTN